jgi:hypothetical protein
MKQISDLRKFWKSGQDLTLNVLENKQIKEFLKKTHGEYDLVIAESYAQEVMYLLSFVQKAPLVLISSKDYSLPHVKALGALSIWSHIPFLFEAHDPSNNIWDRFRNRLQSLILVKMREQFHITVMDRISHLYFSNLQMYSQELPSVLTLEKSACMVIYNSLQMLDLTKPKPEGIIDIAGIHIKKKKDLPGDVKVW